MSFLDAKEHERLMPNDVVTRLCRLATRVATEHYNNSEASDCFCDHAVDATSLERRNMFAPIGMSDYRFSEKVLQFIEKAVDEYLLKEHGND